LIEATSLAIGKEMIHVEILLGMESHVVLSIVPPMCHASQSCMGLVISPLPTQ